MILAKMAFRSNLAREKWLRCCLEKNCVKVRSLCLYSPLIPGKEFRQTRKELVQTTVLRGKEEISLQVFL
jgi:hypothetical protein